jgi:predicted phage tail protein
MVSISIEGRAGKILGPRWKLHIATVGEAIRAIRANTEEVFQRALGASKAYVLVVDGVPVENSGCFLKKIKKSLLIIPVLAGGVITAWYAIFSAVLKIGIGSYVIAGAIATVVLVAAIALIIYGIYMLITMLLTGGEGRTDGGSGTSSYILGGPENVAAQGAVVPVAYGRFMVGSKVISVSSTNVDKSIWEGNDLAGLLGGTFDNTPPEIILKGTPGIDTRPMSPFRE